MKVLDIISSIGLNLIGTIVSTFQEGLQKKSTLLHFVCETIRRVKLLIIVIQMYEVNLVEGGNMITRTHYYALYILIIIKSRAFRYAKFWKFVFPTLFKYRGDIGDTSYIRCRFVSYVYRSCKGIHMKVEIPKNKCAWHLFCEVRQRGSRVMPLFEVIISI